MKLRFACCLLLALSVGVHPAHAADPKEQNYRHAFALIDENRGVEAINFAHGYDPVLNKVILGIYMAQPGNGSSFDDMAAFIASNPGWPGLRGIEAIAEQKIPSSYAPQQVTAWFAQYPAVSLAGFYRYIDALNVSGQSQFAADEVRKRWINGEFNGDELTVYYNRFPGLISPDDSNARLDNWVWKDDVVSARAVYPFVDAGHHALAEARLGLAMKSSNLDRLVTNVPSDLQGDPGLMYERLRWHVHNNQDDLAIAILNSVPENPVKPEAWWEMRQIMARRLIDAKNYEEAYRLVANHGHLETKYLLDAEFLAGWLALRFVNDNDEARQHFQVLFENAQTPISRARGAYWLGRTYEAMGDSSDAEQAYQVAAAMNVTYYGQLAAAKVDSNAMVSAAPEPTIPAPVRNEFYSRDMVQAVQHLYALGEHDRAHSFFHNALDAAQQRSEFALMSELAYRVGRADFAIEAGKAASQKNILMTSGGFPLLSRSLPQPPDPAFTYALIRQESLFNPEAHSPAGAEGLMQLMPSTARGVASKLGMRYRPAMLTDSGYNIKLGTAFVQKQIDNFQGSYVLALAGYNAGPHRVHEWMDQIGDPRQPDVDVVDWIEEIPIYETRNYVERIIEAMQIYRSRLAGKPVPLQIMKDLKRQTAQ
jgi:soluble lytic murein transglycosylase